MARPCRLFPHKFFFWASGPNFQPLDAASNATRSARAEWHDRAAFFPKKKKFCSNSVHQSGGPNRRPNLTKVRTEEDQSSPSRSSIRSGPGPKLHTPSQDKTQRSEHIELVSQGFQKITKAFHLKPHIFKFKECLAEGASLTPRRIRK